MKIASIIAGAAVVAVAGVGVAGTAEAGQTAYYQGGSVCMTVTNGWADILLPGDFVEGKITKTRGWKGGIKHTVAGEHGVKVGGKRAKVAPYYGEMGVVKMKRVSGKQYRSVAACNGNV